MDAVAPAFPEGMVVRLAALGMPPGECENPRGGGEEAEHSVVGADSVEGGGDALGGAGRIQGVEQIVEQRFAVGGALGSTVIRSRRGR